MATPPVPRPMRSRVALASRWRNRVTARSSRPSPAAPPIVTVNAESRRSRPSTQVSAAGTGMRVCRGSGAAVRGGTKAASAASIWLMSIGRTSLFRGRRGGRGGEGGSPASRRGREELVPPEPLAQLRLADHAAGAVLDGDRIGNRRENPAVDLLPPGALGLGERLARHMGPPGEQLVVECPERFPFRQELARHPAQLLAVAAHRALIAARTPGPCAPPLRRRPR